MTETKEKKSKDLLIISVISSIALILALVVISVEINIADSNAFMKEYKECEVAKDLGMTYEDIEHVSKEMMDYLFDKREDLVVPTNIRGQYKDFFNDKERAHMVDVKNLLQNAIVFRRVCLGLAVIGFAVIIFKKKKEAVQYLSRGFLVGTGFTVAFAAVILAIIQINGFTFFWHMFHGVFFTNDLWLMDPMTDMIILLLPEKFFADLIIRCVMLFAIVMVVLLIASTVTVVLDRKSHKRSKYL